MGMGKNNVQHDTLILFSTPHGSHLYGTAHEHSDHDTYRVVSRDPAVIGHNRRGKDVAQRITGKEDVLTIDFSTWVRQLEHGVPQAWEAAFSGMATVDVIADYRRSLRASTGVLDTYLRTIKAFAYDERDGGVKKRRHALRLGLNARDILRYGRFNPTLHAETAQCLWELAQDDADSVYEIACGYVWE